MDALQPGAQNKPGLFAGGSANALGGGVDMESAKNENLNRK